jgi:hypothetical protein
MRLHPARAAGLLRAPWTPAWAKDELSRRARAVPSLDLRFAENKSLVDSVSGQNLITFTRASTGTYVDSDGLIRSAANDAPRFDHNPLTGECLGLLVEEQRQNLLLRSEEFGNASWSVLFSASITGDQATSPTGANTADLLQLSNTNAFSGIRQNFTFSASATYTLSVYARSVTGTSTFRLKIYDGVSDTFSANLEATTTWQRFSLTVTVAAGAGAGNVAVANTVTPSADALYIWGAQLEVGAFPTSYIPTTGTAATRTADVVSISGTNFSSWYRQDEGTVFADAYREFAVPSNFFPHVFDARNTGDDRIQIAYNTESLGTGYSRTSGVDQAVLFPLGLTGVRRRRATFAYKTDDFAAVVNGGSVVTDNSGTPSSVINQAALGGQYGSSSFNLNGTIRRLTYWGQRLQNNILQSITL